MINSLHVGCDAFVLLGDANLCLESKKIMELCGTGDTELCSSIAQVPVLSDSGCLCEPQLFQQGGGHLYWFARWSLEASATTYVDHGRANWEKR